MAIDQTLLARAVQKGFSSDGARWVDVPGVSTGLLLQQQLFLHTGELQVQLEGVVVQVVDVLLDVAAGSLRRGRLVHRQGVRGAGLGYLHAAELAEEVIVLQEHKST